MATRVFVVDVGIVIVNELVAFGATIFTLNKFLLFPGFSFVTVTERLILRVSILLPSKLIGFTSALVKIIIDLLC